MTGLKKEHIGYENGVHGCVTSAVNVLSQPGNLVLIIAVKNAPGLRKHFGTVRVPLNAHILNPPEELAQDMTYLRESAQMQEIYQNMIDALKKIYDFASQG